MLVVLDEPDASLDEEGERALYETLRSLKARGTTCVVITHRLALLGAVDKVLMLRDGQVQAFGPRDQVFAALQRLAANTPRPRMTVAPAPGRATPADAVTEPHA